MRTLARVKIANDPLEIIRMGKAFEVALNNPNTYVPLPQIPFAQAQNYTKAWVSAGLNWRARIIGGITHISHRQGNAAGDEKMACS